MVTANGELDALFSQAVFKTFFDAAPDAILIFSADGRIVAHNDQAKRLFAADSTQLSGLLVESLVPQSMRERHVVLRDGYLAQPIVRSMGERLQLSAVRLDGSQFPVEISLAPLRIGARKSVMAIVRDVTQRLKHRDTERELGRTKAIVEISHAALIEKNFDRLVRMACSVVRRTMAADYSSVSYYVEGEPFVWLAVIDGPGAESLEGRRIAVDGTDGIADRVRRTGAAACIANIDSLHLTLPAELAPLAIKSLAGAPISSDRTLIGVLMVGSVTADHFAPSDLVFLEAIANTLSNAYQLAKAGEASQTARRLESIGQLTGGIAHDFNNVLTVILGNLQLLGDAVTNNEFAARSVNAAERAAQRGSVLTKKLLAFSRHQALRASVIDLGKHLHACYELLERTLGANVVVRLSLPPALPAIEIDAMQLESALLNLAVNARDAMPSGGSLRIDAKGFEHAGGVLADGADLLPGQYVVIRLADNGTGMTPQVLSHVFEPFFTTKPVGQGTGLGLAMVYGFVKQSHGHIAVESEVGRGTTFRLYFPAVATPPAQLRASARTRVAPVASGHGKHLLLVEDDVEVARVATAFLHDLGYRVSVAYTRAEAIELFQGAADIALLLSDVVLSAGESGVEVANQLCLLRPDLPILYCSGYPRRELPPGFDINDRSLFLRKPYSRDQLGNAVAAAFRRSQQRL